MCNPLGRKKFHRLQSASIEALEPRCLLTAVLSAHYDLSGTGADTSESLLTPSTVNTSSFGKQFATPLDGLVFGEPLYVPGIAITAGNQQGTHNVIYVVTENDSLYAIDSQGGTVLWQDSFVGTGNPAVNLLGASSITTVPSGDINSSDITPQIGITATPVINLANNAIYIESKTKQIVGTDATDPHYVAMLFMVDLGSGAIDKSLIIGDTQYHTSNGGYTYRVTNSGTGTDPYVNGTGDGSITSQGNINWGGTSRVYFNAMRQMDRPGLTISGNSLYVSFASHGDNGPYHGWLLRYDDASLALTGVLNTTPNGGLGGIWQGGGPVVIDSSGSIYFESGNGSFNTAASNFGANYSGLPLDADYGESFVKVVNDPTTSQGSQNANGWGLKITDFFAPSNVTSLNNGDVDLGSAGPVILPDAVGSAAHPHLLIGAGKEGKVYLLDRNNLGHFNPNSDNVVQETGANAIGGALSSPAFLLNNPAGAPNPSGILYYQSDYGGYLEAFTVSNGSFSALADSPDYYSSSLDGSPTISANVTATPIVWALYRAGNQLRAYNALNLNNELWTSASKTSGADALSGNVDKFTTPTVADGLVMVADDSFLNVYGPPVPPTSAPAAPGNVAVSSVVYNTVNVSWQDLSNNEDSFYIERSTDQTNWGVVGVVSANVTTYADTTTLENTTYYYRVRAHNSYDGSSYSAYVYSSAIMTPTAPPVGNGDGLLATYYENVSGASPLSGPVVLTRNDPSINFYWGNTAPAPGVSQTNFSVVWTGSVQAPTTGNYVFTTISDDGCQLYLRGNLDIYDWHDQGPTTTNYTTYLTAGQTISVKMEYYQNGGTATAELLWTPPGGSQAPVPFVGGYAVGQYHNDEYLRPAAVLTRVEPTLDSNLEWTNGSPSASILNTNFSATWTGKIQAQYTGSYTFYATGDDGYDLWVNGLPVISNWIDEGPTTNTATVLLSAGQEVPIEFDYFQDGGGDYAQLQWSSIYNQQQDIPQTQLYSGAAPAAPSGLTATATSGTQLTLNWKSNSSIQTGFQIQRKVDGTNTWATIATVGPTITTYNDSNLSPGMVYDYQVQATNFQANSAFSNTAVITMPTIPQTPTAAYASNVTTGSVTANWTDRATNATGYRVGIATGDADFDYILVNDPNLSSYTFTGLEAGTEYDVHISAYNIAGYNDFTGFTTATLTLLPANLAVQSGGGQATLSWAAPAYNAPDLAALTYNVYRGTSPGGEGATAYASGVTGTSYVDAAADASGTTYFYTVTAVDAGGESAASNEVSAAASADFAVGSGANLAINLNAAGAVSISQSGGTITAAENGVQLTFTGIASISVTDTASNDVLNFNGPVSAPVAFSNAGTATINVDAGTLIFAASPGNSVNLGALVVADGAGAQVTAATTDSPTTLSLGALALGQNATLDLTNNVLLLNYGAGADPISAVQQLITSGYSGGAWNGPGILSSTSPANPSYALGYADAADPGNPAGLGSGQIEIRYTLVGDANLDGKVNGADFAILASNFNQAVAGWDNGDFNYDGKANGADFAMLSANFNQGSQIAVTAAAPAAPPVTTQPALAATPTSTTVAIASPATKTPKKAHAQSRKHG
jgi:hypothetical protein